MRPIRLEVEGFGAFKAPTTVDFSDIELVALVGRTGSGKSTVIDAMTFALYGSVARYDDNRAVAPIINQTSTRARVRLDFELGGRRYSAARLVQRQGTGATTKEARLETADDVLASDARGMTAAVTELLGLDAAQFNRTIVLPQGRFADFLHDEPGKRQETLRGLLGFDVYRVIASAARRRGGERRAQVDAMRSETDVDAVALSDDRRAALVEHRDAVVAGRAAVADSVATIEAEHAEVARCDSLLERLAEDLVVLGAVRAPDGVDDLEQALDAAAAALATATVAVGEARERRRVADAAATAGPDVLAVATDLAARREAVRAADEHGRTADALVIAERRVATARTDAMVTRTEQERLDANAEAARADERSIRGMVDAAPPVAQLDHWLTQRRRHAQLAAAVAALTEDAATKAAAAALAIDDDRTARERRDTLQQRAGAAGFVHVLAVGEPCPLCQHEVHELPTHHVDVTGALDDATLAATTAARELAAIERAAHVVDAQLAAEQRALAALSTELADVPADAVLLAQREDAAARNLRLTAAAERTAATEAAAATYRAATTTTASLDAEARAEADAAALRAMESTQRDRLAAAEWAVLALSPLPELERALTTAQELATARDAASEQLAHAEQAHEQAMAGQQAAERAQQSAIEQLRAARDTVAALKPPAVSGGRLGASWQALLEWARAASDERAAERERVTAVRTQGAALIDAADESARKVCAELLGSATGPLPALRDQLVTAEATAIAGLATFDRAREQLTARLARADQLDAERAVADQLGYLLRADGFEAWLMEAALGELIDAGGERLQELSSGQFSLELVGRDVMVRDHANADELRGARTLSGGETFLASLSLALALADATSELAVDGAPRLESIFLDEGFGSLDPATLDVVASAIEELGSAGRMVAVVTHIRELAERMPVRLEVTKVGGSSRVERVDS